MLSKIAKYNLKHKPAECLSFALLLIGVSYVMYFGERTSHAHLFFGFGIAVLGYLAAVQLKIKDAFWIGLILRVLVLFALPNLSEDYFRFLWDGSLIKEGISPFAYQPSDAITFLGKSASNEQGVLTQLLSQMNSPNYYSVYPPLNQWMFFLAAQFSNVYTGMFVLKIFILSAEVGVFFILKKALQRFRKPVSKLNVYWLNPLVILELCGNIHFEGIMLFFFLLSAYYFAKVKDTEGAIYFSFSALTKLFSLMFLPLLALKIVGKRAVKFSLIVFVLVVICFIPFFKGGNLSNFLESIDLYFQSFEFNSGLFYLVRYVGFEIVNYDVIQTAGPIFGLISFGMIMLISFLYRFRNRYAMFTGFLLINTVYLLFSPIVHPWYLVMLVGIGVLTDYKFPIVWSVLIFGSYCAYTAEGVVESKLYIAIEYTIVLFFLLRDIRTNFSFRKLKAGLTIT